MTIIECPLCVSKFRAPEVAGGLVGKLLKCARCGNQWRYEGEGAKAAAALRDMPAAYENASFDSDTLDPDLENDAESTEPQDPEFAELSARLANVEADIPAQIAAERRQKKRARLWILILLLVLAINGAVVVMRAKVVALWPAADRLYELLGVAVPSLGEGLVMRDVTIEMSVEGESTIPMVVKGVVINQSDVPISLPVIQATLRGKDRQPLLAWTIAGDHPVLQHGDQRPFQSHLPELSAEATQVAVTFVDAPKESAGSTEASANIPKPADEPPAPAPTH
ncbi:MAG: hypothetical protein ACK6BL_07020 [Holosporaceae bacterium]|jgi:predicted Zn finger-like uncharacterized protein